MRVGAGEGKTIQSDSTPGKSASLPNFIFSQALLTADFEIGHYIRERIVPRAVLFFTGEALEDESDCEEEESDEDEDDDNSDNDADFDPSKAQANPECKQQ